MAVDAYRGLVHTWTCAEVDREDRDGEGAREPGNFALERFVAFWGTRDASLEGRIECGTSRSWVKESTRVHTVNPIF